MGILPHVDLNSTLITFTHFNTFKDKVLLITGGTGSFGKAVLNKFIDTDFKEIRIFSRDEKKQDDLRKKLPTLYLTRIIAKFK